MHSTKIEPRYTQQRSGRTVKEILLKSYLKKPNKKQVSYSDQKNE